MAQKPAGKRASEDPAEHALVKRQKTSEWDVAVTKSDGDSKSKAVIPKGVPRTSSLQAPIMLLEGHAGEIYTVKFDHTGNLLASGSFDKCIFLWRVYGDCENYMMLAGHKNAVLELHWSADSEQLYSCSADKTVAVWEVATGQRIKKFAEHTGIVNSCSPARSTPNLVCSGADDGTIRVYDLRVRSGVQTFHNGPGRIAVTAVAFNNTGDLVFSGGLDNDIKAWDVRKGEGPLSSLQMQGHLDTVTGISVSPDGAYLLSNSMDNSLRMWDIRPFIADPHGERQVKAFAGAEHNFQKNLLRCCWSPDGSLVSAGSSDRFVYIWEVESRAILYKLPGHKGAVNETAFHPREPIIASCSSDKTIYLGEYVARSTS